MNWVTESFKKVVNSVTNLEKKIDQRAPRQVNEETKVPKLSYAEALIQRNNVTGRSRDIALTSGENNEELLKQIRSDSAFNDLSIENIKKKLKRITYT